MRKQSTPPRPPKPQPEQQLNAPMPLAAPPIKAVDANGPYLDETLFSCSNPAAANRQQAQRNSRDGSCKRPVAKEK
jgi:hypothetical protein